MRQGLLFLNPSKVWLQPPGYVTRMFSRNYQPLLVKCDVQGTAGVLDVNAKRSDDGRTVVLQVVNPSEKSLPATIQFTAYEPSGNAARVEELVGPLQVTNTAVASSRITPYAYKWEHHCRDGKATFTFAPRSFTVMRFEYVDLSWPTENRVAAPP